MGRLALRIIGAVFVAVYLLFGRSTGFLMLSERLSLLSIRSMGRSWMYPGSE